MSDCEPLDFTPVPLRARRDGWTPERQRRFIMFLRGGASPSVAARTVGKSKQTAYALRARTEAASFRAAWDRAVGQARHDAVSRSRERPSQFERAVIGVVQPVMYRGRKVGEGRSFDDRALITMLGRLWRARAGPG